MSKKDQELADAFLSLAIGLCLVGPITTLVVSKILNAFTNPYGLLGIYLLASFVGTMGSLSLLGVKLQDRIGG